MSEELPYDLAGRIIGCATMIVHRTLGPGFNESVYQNALALELSDQVIPFQNFIKLTVLTKSVPSVLSKRTSSWKIPSSWNSKRSKLLPKPTRFNW
ncbi:MAG: GxxExxY protein [Verrucomicrobiota bacterium]